MAFYLVRGQIKPELEAELKERLQTRAFEVLRPFGHSLHGSLSQARRDPASGELLWEEECYCHVPLAQERAAVLDRYFGRLQTERLDRGQGWAQIQSLPLAWP